MIGRRPAILAIGVSWWLALLTPLHAAAQLKVNVVATGLESPVNIVQDPLDPASLFVLEQNLGIRIVRSGIVLPTPFLDLNDTISGCCERGVLGLAFPPDHAASRRFFVKFTDRNGDNVVARFHRSAANPLVADKASRFDLRWPSGERVIRQPFSNHNGGHLLFGPDGFLYIGTGDGGSSNDPEHLAQDPNALLGKMLRIDVNVPDDDPNGYRVPSDNPFLDGSPLVALGEIWAFGLRNPWRYSFDDPARGGTGALVIADVGQGAREEIDYEPAGASGRNYGWRLREGTRTNDTTLPPAYTPLTDPIHEYDHGTGRSITGGFVYRGSALGPAYVGRYFYADFSNARLWSIGLAIGQDGEGRVVDEIEHTSELGGGAAIGNISTFGVDGSGELLFADYAGGRILKIVPAGLPPPLAPANLRSTVLNDDVTLEWNAPSSGSAPAHYVVEAGSEPGANDLGTLATAGPTTELTVADVPDGTYFVRVRAANAAGPGPASNEIGVTVGQGPPCGAPPGAPASLEATKAGTTVSLTWSGPAGPAPVSYLIEVGTTAGGSEIGIFDTGGSITNATGTLAAGRYFIRVRARNTCGAGPASNEVVVDLP
jgi:glucose/arabinose dehydrogenase